MTQEEFYARLKSVPMTVEDLKAFDNDLPYELPFQLLTEDASDDRLVKALADRVSDIKTLPQAKAFMALALSVGFLVAAELDEILNELLAADEKDPSAA